MTHAPNLQPVTGENFYALCRHCGQRMILGDNTTAVADLNGEPWKAWYHGSGREGYDCYKFAARYPASGDATPIVTERWGAGREF